MKTGDSTVFHTRVCRAVCNNDTHEGAAKDTEVLTIGNTVHSKRVTVEQLIRLAHHHHLQSISTL